MRLFEGKPDPLIGTLIAERYRVLSQIGRGGRSAVYKVEHAELGKQLALKVFYEPVSAAQHLAVERQLRWAMLMDHPSFVGVVDSGFLPGGEPYLVMELVSGKTLAEVLAAGALDSARVELIAEQIASGLHAAHARGFAHRDLRPENIFLIEQEARKDVVKIAEFDLVVVEDETSNLVTRASRVFGVPAYMSPEQARGEGGGQKSDQYSLGCIVYEMLTGDVPFSDETPLGTLVKHMRAQVEPPSQRRPDLAIPSRLQAAVMQMLAKQPQDRFGSMQELARALTADSDKEPRLHARTLAADPMTISEPSEPILMPIMSPSEAPNRPSEPMSGGPQYVNGPPGVTPIMTGPHWPAAGMQPSAGPSLFQNLRRLLFGKRGDGQAEEAFAALDRALFGVDAPRRMQVEQPVKVKAVAIRNALAQPMVKAALEHDGARIESLPLGKTVRVELVPDIPQDFTVVPHSEAEQPVLRSELTYWEWTVTAHTPGQKRTLRLRATNSVDADGKVLRKSHPVRTIEVEVQVLAGEASAEPLPELATPLLRKLLDRVLRTDVDVEAFLLDYFPEVFRRLGHKMERTQKLNLLFSHATSADILCKLRETEPTTVEAFLQAAPAPVVYKAPARILQPAEMSEDAMQRRPVEPLLQTPPPRAYPRLRVAVVLLGAALAGVLLHFLPQKPAMAIGCLLATAIGTVLIPSR